MRFVNPHKPLQGVRQRLRDLLIDHGVVEPFRIDRITTKDRLQVTSKLPIALPEYFERKRVVWRQADTFILNYEERLRAQRDALRSSIPRSTDLLFKEFIARHSELQDQPRSMFFHCVLYDPCPIQREGFIVSTVDQALELVSLLAPARIVCGTASALEALAGCGIPVAANPWYEGSIFLVYDVRSLKCAEFSAIV